MDKLPPDIQKIIMDRGCLHGRIVPINTVFVLRGPPGCGKSTLSNKLFLYADSVGIKKTICNADEWFYIDGVYRWYRRGLSKSHAYSKGQFALAMLEKHQVIVVDNTNFKRDHVMWYVDQAKFCDYHVVVVEWEVDESNAHEMARRSLHVPEDYPNWRKYCSEDGGFYKLTHEDKEGVQLVKLPFERSQPNRAEHYGRRGYYFSSENGETGVQHLDCNGRGYDRDVMFRTWSA